MNIYSVKKTLLVMLLFLLPGFVVQVNAQVKSEKKDSTIPAAKDTIENAEDLTEFSRSRLIYDSEGKRDPFETLVPKVVEEEKKIKGLFNYEKATLSGIVRTENDIYALVIDADNFGYVLRKGYRVFGGFVEQITDDALYLHIVKYGRSLSIIMRLESTISTVLVEQERGESYIQKPGINIEYSKENSPTTDIMIEDVIVPSMRIKTVEDEWFGSGSTEPVTEKTDAESSKINNTGSFSLIDPPDNTWITLPYILDWTTQEGTDVLYTVIIDDNSDFNSPLLIKGGVNTSSYLLGLETGLPQNKKLFWKITARDVSGIDVTCRRTDMSFRIAGNQ